MRGSSIGGPPVATGRDVLEVEDRQPLGGLAGERAHDRPIAVSEQHMVVDPGLGIGGEERGLELAGRQGHPLICAIEMVTIHIHIMELVVGPNLLQLTVGIHQRLPVP